MPPSCAEAPDMKISISGIAAEGTVAITEVLTNAADTAIVSFLNMIIPSFSLNIEYTFGNFQFHHTTDHGMLRNADHG